VIAQVLAERKDRTKLGLSKFTAEAAELAAGHPDKLGIAVELQLAGLNRRRSRGD